MNIVGIDPGKSGGIAELFWGKQLSFAPLPLTKDGKWSPWLMESLAHSWRQRGMDRVVIEKCQAFPGISARANAEVMYAYGMWLGALAHCFDPQNLIRVRSQDWKRAMGLTKTPLDTLQIEQKGAYKRRKQAALGLARQLFPEEPFRTARGRDLDGPAEAALIAMYGRTLAVPND